MNGDPEVLGAAADLFGRITSLRHGDNVDAAYECKSGVDRCYDCAADFDALATLDVARDSRPVGEGLREALAVYGLLVGRCGADEVHRDAFVSAWIAPTDMPFEWRFQGALGFGGKVYRNAGRIYASCYREDETPERLDSIRSVNLWLDRLSRLQAGPAAVRPATPRHEVFTADDGDLAIRAAVRPVEREGDTKAVDDVVQAAIKVVRSRAQGRAKPGALRDLDVAVQYFEAYASESPR